MPLAPEAFLFAWCSGAMPAQALAVSLGWMVFAIYCLGAGAGAPWPAAPGWLG
jgi:hypothetical protein